MLLFLWALVFFVWTNGVVSVRAYSNGIVQINQICYLPSKFYYTSIGISVFSFAYWWFTPIYTLPIIVI